jgi:hypothetical protein
MDRLPINQNGKGDQAALASCSAPSEIGSGFVHLGRCLNGTELAESLSGHAMDLLRLVSEFAKPSRGAAVLVRRCEAANNPRLHLRVLLKNSSHLKVRPTEVCGTKSVMTRPRPGRELPWRSESSA